MNMYTDREPGYGTPEGGLAYCNTSAFKVLRPSGPSYWKMLNGYLMFSVVNIVQNVKLIELLCKKFAPLHFVISKN